MALHVLVLLFHKNTARPSFYHYIRSVAICLQGYLIDFHLRSSIQLSVSFRSFPRESCRTLEPPRTRPARRPEKLRDSDSRRPEKLTRPPRMLRAPRRAMRRARREQLETRPTRLSRGRLMRPGLRKTRLGRPSVGRATR